MKERRFDVLKTYVKTSFFRAFMSKDEHNKNFFEILYLICDYPHKHYTFKHFEA